MVTLNVSIDDGDGYIHLISSCMTLNNSGYPTKHDGLVALCGHDIPIDATLCDARNAGGVIWKGQAFKPDDLAQVIMRLRQDGYMCRECVREHFRRVGGIPGLFHDRWTEDLHTDHGEVHVSAGKEWVEFEVCGDILVSFNPSHWVFNPDNEGDVRDAFRFPEPCPTCGSPLKLGDLMWKAGEIDRVWIKCTGCNRKANFIMPESIG